MKIKKYQGETEEQVIEMAKQELGNDAIVLSIKRITPTGIFSIIKKPYIELTASYDENKVNIESKQKGFFIDLKGKISSNSSLEDKLKEKDNTIEKLEKRIVELEGYLEKAMKSLSIDKNSTNNKYKNQVVQFIYEMLLSKGVHSSVCNYILEVVDNEENQNIDLIVKIVYTKIVEILNNVACDSLEIENNKVGEPKTIVFLGTTGVGKTTTIAKLSSQLIMNKNKKVGFITSDTYRIAAVEQLKTYAEILGSQVEIVYKIDDVKEKINKLKIMNDYIFFDTAGRSHKNQKNMEEIKELLNEIDNPEIYLVVSSTGNFEDIENIISAYSKFSNFNLIFTKIDETDTIGTILNIAYYAKNKIAYVTVGQNVPSDIEKFSGEKIAKVLLGSMYK